jgi:hypothetical protein
MGDTWHYWLRRVVREHGSALLAGYAYEAPSSCFKQRRAEWYKNSEARDELVLARGQSHSCNREAEHDSSRGHVREFPLVAAT